MREHIKYGYKLYNGVIMPNSGVDTYNAIQDRINSFLGANIPVPEYLLNASHSLIASYAENLNGSK